MSFNLLDLVKDQVTGQLAKQASSFLGESEENTSKGLNAIFPALLGAAADKAESGAEGASSLLNLIGGLDTNALGNIGSLFGGGASSVNSLLNSGGGIVNLLLGNKIGGVVDVITKLAGIKSGSASSLIKMAAPFLLSILGKKVAGGGVSGLLDLLKSQKPNVAASLPAGLGSSLGLSSFGDLLGDATGKVGDLGKGAIAAGAAAVGGAAALGGNAIKGATGAVGDVAGSVKGAAGKISGNISDVAGKVNVKAPKVDVKAPKVDVKAPKVNAPKAPKGGGLGFLKFLLPVAAIAGGLFFANQQGCFSKGADALGEGVSKVGDLGKGAADLGKGAVAGAADLGKGAVDGVKAVGEGAVAGVGSLFGKVDEAAQKALGAITFATGSAGAQIKEFIEGGAKGDAEFQFKNLNFASGKYAISAEGQKEVDNLAAILKAYPTVKAEIAGYTDSRGNADLNQKLSENRANAVKGRLIAAGIAGDRLTSKGYGAADPIATNDTAEGRAQNRRTIIRIAK